MIPVRTRFVPLAAALILAGLAGAGDDRPVAPASATDLLPADATPRWIWTRGPARADQTVYFRKEIQLERGIRGVKLYATCDNEMTILLDGKPVAASKEWEKPVYKDVTRSLLRRGQPGGGGGGHVIAAECRNREGIAGLLVRIVFESAARESVSVVSDATWRVSERAEPGWANIEFDDHAWASAGVVAKLGAPPWTSINAAAMAAASRFRDPTATPPAQLKVAKGFRVELLYTVPKETQGSWVNMTVDPKGRLIVSDQYGKLYRVTPPPVGAGSGASAGGTHVEPIDVEIGEAQGLTWAFESLYVVVNRGEKYPSGLYRVRDTDGDDRFDKVETLRALQGGGEHGPHAVVLGPDGKSLYVVTGNANRLTELAGSLVPRIWGEDEILPHLPDGRGFMRNETAPGGCIYRVDPEGKSWVLVSMGYRNPYDIAFDRHGDLFTYDSDMEWDMNTPWYRPTRVCLAASGSDFGYRNGSGKWPPYYPDSLPPVLNIGPGSPTGITFGYGARFPAKYQECLYISDWSYGKLYAVHLTPAASAYTAEIEEFITGAPLPLTDIVVNPIDRAMYFTIGGRRTLSGLYRVTYAGDEPADESKSDGSFEELRSIRRKLEAFHGHKDPAAVGASWPYLGHSDRFIQFAARVAIEHQDVHEWQDRALAERNAQAALTALLALARAGEKATQPGLLEALERLAWNDLSETQRLELLRVYGLAFIRMGSPDAATAARVAGRFDPFFPAQERALNAELCKLLVSLQAPSAAAKSIELMAKAPTQEEQMEYAAALRKLRVGWTPELRQAYFEWFRTALHYKGGASFTGFLREIRDDAVSTLSPQEQAALKPLLSIPLQEAGNVAALPPRPFVKAWTVDELAATIEGKLSKRSFERGRSLFAAAACFSCHRFADEGGTVGPDLTGVAGRFSPRDLLESIILPSKSISDQYQAVTIAMADGRVITGRIVNLSGDSMSVNTNMLDPNAQEHVDRRQVEETKPSPVSMMPDKLLDTLNREEVLDLMAYLLSGGDPKSAMFH